MLRFFLVTALAWTWVASAQADTDRFALVIGNGAYANLPPLENAVPDARALDEALRRLGFQTSLVVDAGGRDLNRALHGFAGQITPGGVGLVFYAGHGIEADGRNYLIPVDADLETEIDLRFAAIDLGEVLGTLREARARLTLVVLDACRDNPLPQRGRSAARGLARIQAPTGTFVAMSAAPGGVAFDGPKGGNGIYTDALLKVIEQPGLKLEEVFKQVAERVRRTTGGLQEPWIQASIVGDFYFKRSGSDAAGTATAATPTAPDREEPALRATVQDPARIAWDLIQGLPDDDAKRRALAVFIPAYGNSLYGPAAKVLAGALGPGAAAAAPAPALQAAAQGTGQLQEESEPAVPDAPEAAQPAPADPLVLPVIEQAGDYVAVKRANVRDAPSTGGNRIGTLDVDEAVRVTGRLADGSW